MARHIDHKRSGSKALATAGITGATAALGSAFAAPLALAQDASVDYPNHGAWASAGLDWNWFYVIVGVLFVVSLIVTVWLSGKNSRRTGRREGGI